MKINVYFLIVICLSSYTVLKASLIKIQTTPLTIQGSGNTIHMGNNMQSWVQIVLSPGSSVTIKGTHIAVGQGNVTVDNNLLAANPNNEYIHNADYLTLTGRFNNNQFEATVAFANDSLPNDMDELKKQISAFKKIIYAILVLNTMPLLIAGTGIMIWWNRFNKNHAILHKLI